MRNILRRERAQAIMTAGRVSALMRERGISTASLAKSVRIQRSTLENFCAGRRIPSDLLDGIARTLETSVAYLLAISDDPAPTSAVRWGRATRLFAVASGSGLGVSGRDVVDLSLVALHRGIDDGRVLTEMRPDD
jgi:hypothetical protein